MSLTGYTFFSFLAVVVAVRWALPARLREAWILVASYVFYVSLAPGPSILLAALTIVAWAAALGMERWPAWRRVLLAGGIAAALLTLAWFKYAGLIGAGAGTPASDALVPAGLSFYSFRLVSYLVDTYRGRRAERSIVSIAAYVAFFPQILAGPIARADQTIAALRSRSPIDWDLASRGVFLVLRGLVKKMVLADGLAPWVDAVFRAPLSASTIGAWTGMLAYTGQIYCDFSGYTDIARGCSMMLGVDAPENFDLPYASASPREFWRRWHMTLSLWLRDYLYVPLGGSRKGVARYSAAIMITMVLGGMWHGADARFLVWGGYHGVLLLAHRAWLAAAYGPRMAALRGTSAFRCVAVAVTLLLVALGWVMFRADGIREGWAVYGALFSGRPHGTTPVEMAAAARILAVVAFGHALGTARVLERSYDGLPASARGIVWAAMAAALYLFAGSSGTFIYQQF